MTDKKLAILLPNLGGGGAERLSLDLAEQFSDMGVTCSFIVGQKKGALVEQAETIAEIHDLGAKRILDVARSLPEMVARTRPDAVISNIWPLTAVSAVALRRARSQTGLRLALVEHNPLSLQYSDWSLSTRIGLAASLAIGNRFADVRIGVSRGVADDVAKLARMASSQFDVIHNPVVAPLKPAPAAVQAAEALWSPHAKQSGETKGRRFLSVGSFKSQKNFALAISAFAKIRRSGDLFIILGEGGLRPELEAQIDQLGLSGSVILPGFLSETAALYHSADLFVLSSNYEGFGNVIVEALGSGLPVVATDCPTGPSEILDRPEYGNLVPVGNADALAHAMDTVALRADANSGILIERAQAFAPERIAREYLSLLFPD